MRDILRVITVVTITVVTRWTPGGRDALSLRAPPAVRGPVSWLVLGVAMAWAGAAGAQTADLEGHVFARRGGIPLGGAVVVVYENVTAGPVPILLAESRTDDNGFYQVRIPTPTFPSAVVEVFCRVPTGDVVRGLSTAPLQDGVIRRRDVYLETRRGVRECLDPEPGDVPPFLRP